VAAGVERFELIIDVNFFAGLQACQQTLAVVLFELAAVQINAILRGLRAPEPR
jgi:hypothetical protein